MKTLKPIDPCFEEYWDYLVNRDRSLCALSSTCNLKYSKEYYGKTAIKDLSCIVIEGKKAICGLAAFLYIDEFNNYKITCHGQPIKYLEVQSDKISETRAASRILVKELKKQITYSTVSHKQPVSHILNLLHFLIFFESFLSNPNST